MNRKRVFISPGQISLLDMGERPQLGQPMSWERRQKLMKPKGGRNRAVAEDNFHNRDYDFESPDGEIFTGKGIRIFARQHGNERK